MAFEDYSPRDRHLSGRALAASWIILTVLVIILAIAVPMTHSSGADTRLAVSAKAHGTV